ncbi:hypothetical protein LY78DRAFT_45327 [Colletotrichum sublineola]|nr:hypothetical protein LY78DRAFT_45327 [Colletotrichum sublineola]
MFSERRFNVYKVPHQTNGGLEKAHRRPTSLLVHGPSIYLPVLGSCSSQIPSAKQFGEKVHSSSTLQQRRPSIMLGNSLPYSKNTYINIGKKKKKPSVTTWKLVKYSLATPQAPRPESYLNLYNSTEAISSIGGCRGSRQTHIACWHSIHILKVLPWG